MSSTQLSTAEAAEALGITSTTTIALVKRGELKAAYYCGAYHFDPADLNAFVNSSVGKRGR